MGGDSSCSSSSWSLIAVGVVLLLQRRRDRRPIDVAMPAPQLSEQPPRAVPSPESFVSRTQVAAERDLDESRADPRAKGAAAWAIRHLRASPIGVDEAAYRPINDVDARSHRRTRHRRQRSGDRRDSGALDDDFPGRASIQSAPASSASSSGSLRSVSSVRS